MSLPSQHHHAPAGFMPSTIAATHTQLSSLAAANQLEVPVRSLRASLSLLMAIFPGEPGLASFIEAWLAII